MNINGFNSNESKPRSGQIQHSDWLNEFVSVYQHLSTDNLGLIDSIYDPEIHFVDPMHELHGRTQLLNYFEGLYKNLNYCRFVIDNVIQQADEAAIYWEMTYQHRTLNKGKMVTVRGSSHLKAENGKIIYHRDYLDLGAMLYEQLPLIGQFISWIKNKASK
jgi:limonene-1,2-epoxide hydrolase